MAEVLPEDSGVIRCICGYDHDDNFTIQCERCNAWQHATCVSITDESAVPENYLCPDCGERKVVFDRVAARDRQRLVLQQKADFEKAARERSRHPTRSSSADDEEEVKRRRGRKRHEDEHPHDQANSAEPPLTRAKNFNVPVTSNSWTDNARELWETEIKENNLPAYPVKDAKAAPSLKVARRPTDRVVFGLSATTLVTTANIASRKFVCEVVGEVLLRSEYAAYASNQYARLGCPKPGVVFVPGMPLAVDSRRRGSIALFLRRSSNPNAKLVATRDAKGELRLLVYTRKAVKSGSELTLGWPWPETHPLRTGTAPSLVKNSLWLLGCSEAECAAFQEEDDEDWELTYAPPRQLPRGMTVEVSIGKHANTDDRGEAVVAHVWVPAPQNVAPPPKKKMSLADYMRKRA